MPKLHVFLFAVALASVSAVFWLAVREYPRLFTLAESARPENFLDSVRRAEQDGDLEKALAIARSAVRRRGDDPLTHTELGRLLLERGEEEAAVESFRSALAIPRAFPGYRRTHMPYFFAPARNALARRALAKGNPGEAIEHLELARSGVDAAGDAKGGAEWKFDVYWAEGLWARALEHGEPTDAQVAALAAGELRELGRVAVGLRDWTLAEEAGRWLVETRENAGEGHFFVARAQLSRRDLQGATASLYDAVAAGYTDAAYYLASVLQNNPARAVEVLDQLPSDSFFKPFALAWRLAYDENIEAAERDALSEAFAEYLESGFEIRDFHLATEHLNVRPRGMSVNRDYFQPGGRFPVAIAWTVEPAPTGAESGAVEIVAEPDEGIIVRRGAWRLQMQWVENEVAWFQVEQSEPGSERPPGWIDAARDWYGLREASAVFVEGDSANTYLRVANDNIDTFGWVYSAPAKVEASTSYIAAGRVKSIDAKAVLAWQGLNDNEKVEFDARIANQVDSKDWTWHAGYAPSVGLWTAARLSLGVTRHVGSAAFDDLLLIKLNPPSF